MTYNSDIQIAMIGTGYVGLVSGSCFANDYPVICVDKDEHKIKNLKTANIPIYEPALEALVRRHVDNKRLEFSTDLPSAVKKCTVIFIAVGTPTRPEDGRADLKYIEEVAIEIAPLLTEYKVIIIKSTVPVGTGHHVKKLIYKINPKAKFDMVSNPEFLREGSAVHDFMNPDRIIVGSETDRAKNIMNKIYASFMSREISILHSDLVSAELIKYSANCFLATKIAFINEIANVCEKTGADIEQVTKALGLDKRIGADYLQPGPGFGGSCFPKDTLALMQMARDIETPVKIIEAVVASNNQRKTHMVNKIIAACGGSVKDKKLAILGIAFKANTDDFRESASLPIIQGLQKKGAIIVAYDPGVLNKAQSALPNVHWMKDAYSAIEGGDAVVIVTEWKEFADLDLVKVKSLLRKVHIPPTLIDLRNLYDPNKVKASGIRYVSMGRRIAGTSNLTPALSCETGKGVTV